VSETRLTEARLQRYSAAGSIAAAGFDFPDGGRRLEDWRRGRWGWGFGVCLGDGFPLLGFEWFDGRSEGRDGAGGVGGDFREFLGRALGLERQTAGLVPVDDPLDAAGGGVDEQAVDGHFGGDNRAGAQIAHGFDDIRFLAADRPKNSWGLEIGNAPRLMPFAWRRSSNSVVVILAI